MRGPVPAVIEGKLLRLAPIRTHPPDLLTAAAVGVEVDVLAVGRTVGIIADAIAGRQRMLLAALRRDREDIPRTVTRPRKHDRLAVRRPAMEVRGGMLRQQARRASAR